MSKSILGLVILITIFLSSCTTPQGYLRQADEVAYGIIADKQLESGESTSLELYRLPAAGAAGSAQEQLRQQLLLDQQLPTLSVASNSETPADSPKEYSLSLIDALQVAAHNSRDYQQNKETLFRQALELDLQRDMFTSSFTGLLSSMWSTSKDGGTRTGGLTHNAQGGWQRTFTTGVAFATSIGFDLVQLLTANRVSARGIVADASISVPLLRGAGQQIVTEDLQQAERNVLYAMWDFERYRRTFAVQVASQYLLVLEQMNRVTTAYDNYQRLMESRQRAERLADAGRLPQIQVGQALQDELRARSSWVSAQQSSADSLDSFKLVLGLSPDAVVRLDRQILNQNVVPKIEPEQQQVNAVPTQLLPIALANRRDLRIAQGRVQDSERALFIAEDNLRADVTLLGSGSAGSARTLASATSDDGHLDLDHGQYAALLKIDLPFERTAERNAWRNSWFDWNQSKRDLAELEDLTKYQVLSAWRDWREALELIKIQTQALEVAQRRVASTNLFLQAGRIQMRDLLEAQDALVSARNALVAAQVQYRISAMELQRDLGTLDIDPAGKWLKDVIKYASLAQK
ncbi:MAG: TolC family protein [Desulfuromonas sp.]|nr:TolC family protein [Desulfuromonas sp.]